MRHTFSNFKILENIVHTQYGDMTGLIQIDGHTSLSELRKLCEEKGIEREKYFLIGFGFSDFTTNGIGEDGNVICTVLLLETEKYAQTFDEIKEQLSLNPKVDVIKKTFEIDYRDFGKYIKRVDSMMLTQLGNYIQEMNIIDEDEE